MRSCGCLDSAIVTVSTSAAFHLQPSWVLELIMEFSQVGLFKWFSIFFIPLVKRVAKIQGKVDWNTVFFILTYSMEQSPSWEANWSAASQEIPRTLWNPKVNHRTHKRTPPVPILSQLHPVHTPASHFPKIHPKIILLSTPGSPQWSPFLRFPHQNPVTTSPLTHTRYVPRPSHSSRFYHLHNTIFFISIWSSRVCDIVGCCAIWHSK
jgi:hypothetical protein